VKELLYCSSSAETEGIWQIENDNIPLEMCRIPDNYPVFGIKQRFLYPAG